MWPFTRSISRNHDQEIGRRGEKQAARYLKSQKYKILARNLHLSVGEVDLLVRSNEGALVIVEVKSSASATADMTPPELHVDHVKQAKLRKLAIAIMKQYHYDWQTTPLRIDVVGVVFPPQGKPIIRHHPNAVQFQTYA
ncbi:YraN family protein [Poriferisphaera sp. WC338]|uniref:YraN family protein n=1 Tax=Poriferisphaera sp. WC338 TaxID=3425129 RepID=UPI003D815072